MTNVQIKDEQPRTTSESTDDEADLVFIHDEDDEDVWDDEEEPIISDEEGNRRLP